MKGLEIRPQRDRNDAVKMAMCVGRRCRIFKCSCDVGFGCRRSKQVSGGQCPMSSRSFCRVTRRHLEFRCCCSDRASPSKNPGREWRSNHGSVEHQKRCPSIWNTYIFRQVMRQKSTVELFRHTATQHIHSVGLSAASTTDVLSKGHLHERTDDNFW